MRIIVLVNSCFRKHTDLNKLGINRVWDRYEIIFQPKIMYGQFQRVILHTFFFSALAARTSLKIFRCKAICPELS